MPRAASTVIAPGIGAMASRVEQKRGVVRRSRPVAPVIVEYAYYASMLYAVAGVALGAGIPLFGAGLVALLAAVCVARVGLRARKAYGPIMPALLCAVTSVAIQVQFHHESVMADYV